MGRAVIAAPDHRRPPLGSTCSPPDGASMTKRAGACAERSGRPVEMWLLCRSAQDPGSIITVLSVGVSWAKKAEVHDAQGGDAAVCEMVAGVAALRGPEGLEELVVDLARTLADVIERIATAEGLAAEDSPTSCSSAKTQPPAPRPG